jgi:ABC-type sugar transport system ATPase subunit
MSQASRDPIMVMDSITKSYNGVKALDKVHLELRRGAIHGLVGHNGAGKSTLVKIVSGALQPDAGTITIGGRVLALTSPRQAHRNGIAVLFQELTLWPTLSVAQNLWLETHAGHDPRVVFPHRLRGRAIEALRSIAPAIDPSEVVARLSFADQQLVAIARILQLRPKLLVLDEPTSGLGPSEVRRLGTVIRGLAASGVCVLFISHRLAEVFEFCVAVTVLRDGRVVGEFATSSISPNEVVHAMSGAAIARSSDSVPAAAETAGQTVLRATDLYARGRQVLSELELREGEVVGVLGLPGSGRESLLYSLVGDRTFGRWRRVSVTRTPRQPRARIGIVPGHRHREGLFGPLSVRDNVAIGSTKARRVRNFQLETRVTRGLMSQLRIRSADIRDAISTLSGGNQQKVVIARQLAAETSVLVMDQPTNGVDVRSRAEIYREIKELRSQGVALVVGSTETDELMEICTRILVMYANRVVAELTPPYEETRLMMAATGISGPETDTAEESSSPR